MLRAIGSSWFPLQRVCAGFTGANAHDLFKVEDENLSVADLPGVGGLFDRLDHALDELGLDGSLDLHLRQEVDDVFGAAVELGVTLLPAESLDLGDGDSLHADCRKGLADLVELERLDDGGDELHGFLVVSVTMRWI